MVDTPESIYSKILRAEKPSTVQDIIDKENSKRIRVHMPAKVIKVNGTTVDVEIQGKEDTGFGYYSSFAPLLNLPIIYNNYTSKAYIITPIQEGDTGLVEFIDFNSSNFQDNGSTELTSDTYYHSLNNGVFINGFIPNSKVLDVRKPDTDVISSKNNPEMLEEPTDELWDRPKIQNEDGTYSTSVTVTIGIEYGNQEALAVIPTVYDGKKHTVEEATERFYKTHLHFGIFKADSPDVVEQYSENVHNAQEKYIFNNNMPIIIGLHNQTFAFYVDDSGGATIESLSNLNFKSGTGITMDSPEVKCSNSLGCGNGANGSFTAGSKTITVTNGIITNID